MQTPGHHWNLHGSERQIFDLLPGKGKAPKPLECSVSLRRDKTVIDNRTRRDDIGKSDMDYEYVPCYICGGTDTTPWANENGFDMVKCDHCALVYVNPRPSQESIDEAAHTGMHESEKQSINTIGLYSGKKVAEYQRKVSGLFPDGELAREPCRWLDIGAGFGEFIESLTSLTAPGSVLMGLEPCEPKVRKAKSRGIPIENTRLSELDGQYTHISLVNVLSHLPNPVIFLKELREILEPRGQVVLVTGNGGDIRREDFPGSLYLPDHLSFAGVESIRKIFDLAGYDVREINLYPQARNDGYVTGILKNIARKIMGRATVPLSVPKNSPFRSMWVHAELREDS